MAVMALGVLAAARPTPASWREGLAAALIGELWRLYALGYSGEHTRRTDLEAPELITAGPFSLCRNPLYLGNILNAFGVAWAAAGGWSLGGHIAVLACCALTTFAVYGQCIAAEERFLRERFGQEYLDYCARVPRLLPRWRAAGTVRTGRFLWSNLRFERMTLLWWQIIWAYLGWLSLA